MKTIQLSKDIFPLNIFKSKASSILKQLKVSQRPVVITQNGSPSAVLLTPESYDELVANQKFINAVNEGLSDVKNGLVIDDADLSAILSKEFGKTE